MEAMGGDRKVWTAMETRALITLKEEMKLKFQTMKRNRTLWIELSDKMRKLYGHERSPAQCAVRWKNIISAYKDSREALRNPRPDGKVCLFFKEVEAILGDPPLKIPAAEPVPIQTPASIAPALQTPRKSERSREPRDGNIAALLLELISKIDAQGAAIARIEKVLEKAEMNGTTPVPETLRSTERIPAPLPENISGVGVGPGRPYDLGDPDVLLTRPSTASVPDLDASSDGGPHANNDTGTVDSARPGLVNTVHSLPCTDQNRREEDIAQPGGVGEAAGDRRRSTSPSSVPIVPSTEGNDRVAGADGRFLRTEASIGSVCIATVQQAMTAIPKATEVQGSDGSVGANVDMELVSSELGNERSSAMPAAKKRKFAHTCTSD